MNEPLSEQLKKAVDQASRSALLLQAAETAEDNSEDSQASFSDALEAILETPTMATQALLTWLGDTPKKAAAKALLRRLSVNHLHDDRPTCVELPHDSDALAVARTLRRIHAISFCVPYNLGWALSVLRRWGTDTDYPWLAARDALAYLRQELPEPLLHVLRNADLTGMSTDTLNLLEALKADMAEEERVLQSYPRLREFCMSSEEVDYVRAIRAATEREILSEAKEKSIFFALFPTHKFKYATSVVIGAGPSATPVEMQLHSGETALPLSEALDPLGGLQRREALWKGTGQ